MLSVCLPSVFTAGSLAVLSAALSVILLVCLLTALDMQLLPSLNLLSVSSEKNILTESPDCNFSLPSAFLSLSVIFFFLSILYIKLLLAADRYFERYLSSLWLSPNLSIINSFIQHSTYYKHILRQLSVTYFIRLFLFVSLLS